MDDDQFRLMILDFIVEQRAMNVAIQGFMETQRDINASVASAIEELKAFAREQREINHEQREINASLKTMLQELIRERHNGRSA